MVGFRFHKCKNENCYQTFRLGAECPLCWMVEEE